jgi:hypothetical protein
LRNIGVCGDDCSVCLRYIATKNANENDLNRVKEIWVSLGWREPGIDAHELKCFGCCKENRCAYQEIRDCAFGKNFSNCGLCTEYPCALSIAAFEKTEKAFLHINNINDDEEKQLLINAFRHKKLNLDTIHNDSF